MAFAVDTTMKVFPAIGYSGTDLGEVPSSSCCYKTEKSFSADEDNWACGSTIAKDHSKLEVPLDVMKDFVGCSAAGVVAGAGEDLHKWVTISAEVGADPAAADIVYGYS